MVIDKELNVVYQDAGPWRSYTLSAEGESLEELLDSAHIFEIDQDGGNLGDFSLSNAPNNLYKEALEFITTTYYKNAFGR